MRRFLIHLGLLWALTMPAQILPTVAACPSCKVANESGDLTEEEIARPKAYMYSILFMISMPVTLFSGFGFAFWKMTRATAGLEAPPAD